MSLQKDTPISAGSFNQLYQQVLTELKRRKNIMGNDFFKYDLDENFVAEEGKPISKEIINLIDAVIQVNDIQLNDSEKYQTSNIHKDDQIIENLDPNLKKIIQLESIKNTFNDQFECRGGCVGLCMGSCLNLCQGTVSSNKQEVRINE